MPDKDDMNQERLDQLDRDIEQARRTAEDVLPGEGEEPTGLLSEGEREYHESGEIAPEQDDQTITPG